MKKKKMLKTFSNHTNLSNLHHISGFGFCEYANPDAGLRAIRLLHEKEIGEKKLVVTVDAKAKTILDEYKRKYFPPCQNNFFFNVILYFSHVPNICPPSFSQTQ